MRPRGRWKGQVSRDGVPTGGLPFREVGRVSPQHRRPLLRLQVKAHREKRGALGGKPMTSGTAISPRQRLCPLKGGGGGDGILGNMSIHSTPRMCRKPQPHSLASETASAATVRADRVRHYLLRGTAPALEDWGAGHQDPVSVPDPNPHEQCLPHGEWKIRRSRRSRLDTHLPWNQGFM